MKLKKSFFEKWGLPLLSAIILIIYLFPFYIVVVNAFKTALLTAENDMVFPHHLILENFEKENRKE